MIEVKGLTKKYGNHLAVDNLSFTVEDGQIYGFLGPNGAGKSTTMNMITGCISATDGSVVINGHDIFDEPKLAKKEIGYLPEIPPLYLEFTIREYLRFVCELKGVPQKEIPAEIDRVLDETNTVDYADRPCRTLSKGYRQRVGLAQALVGSPSIIILDEPSIGLDPKQIIEMRELIRGLKGRHTVILSSHILSEVSAVCDHIVIIAKGKLVGNGTPEELAEKLHANSKLIFTARGAADTISEIVQSIEGVSSVELTEGDEAGTVNGTIELEGDNDLRDKLSLELAAKGFPILSMTIEKANLEDVFLELTYGAAEENAEEGSDKAAEESEEAAAEDTAEAAEEEAQTEAPAEEKSIPEDEE